MKEAFDIMAAAHTLAMNDPACKTSEDVVRRMVEALAAHGFMVVPKTEDGCPHCGAGNVGDCRLPKCLWTN
jgi:hypothetical protein